MLDLPRLPQDMLEGYRRLVDLTGTVSDAMDELGIVGVVPAYVLPPVAVGKRIVGPALTVRNIQRTEQIHKAALDKTNTQGETEAHNLAEPGDVLVIEGIMGCSNMGGQSATIARRQGFIGAIVDATLRDPQQYRRWGGRCGAAASPRSPASGACRQWRSTARCRSAACRCGPGDLVCADEAGVAFVPRERAAEVLEAARKIDAGDTKRKKDIEGGASVAELLDQEIQVTIDESGRLTAWQLARVCKLLSADGWRLMKPTNLLVHPVRRAQQARRRLLRASDGEDAESRRARRARHALYQRLHQLPDLRAGARELRHRTLRAPGALLGQRDRLQGQPPSWGHRLMEQGHHVAAIGKLHYQDSKPQVNGFNEEILPLHIVNGVGDLLGLIRDELPRRAGLAQAGPRSGARRIRIHALRPQHRRRGREVAEALRAEASRQAVGALRRLRVAALPADRAAAVLRPVPGGQGAVARHVRAGRAPAPPVHRRDAQVPVLRRAVRRADGAAGDRRLLRPRLVPR